jgi:c-di-AMP phosphodiesterase-like protein
MENISDVLDQFRDSLLNSPHVAIMVVDKGLNIVWHNQAFAHEFQKGDDLVSKKCHKVLGSEAQHKGCPTQASLYHGKYTKSFFDFGDKNFFALTIPLGNGLAAKIHTYLPKTAENTVEEA